MIITMTAVIPNTPAIAPISGNKIVDSSELGGSVFVGIVMVGVVTVLLGEGSRPPKEK